MTETTQKTYSNPRKEVVIDNWPYGVHRVAAQFMVEANGRGERAVRITENPKRPGAWNKPKKRTYAETVRIVDGSDGRTYVAEHSRSFISIVQSNLKFQEETIWPDDPRYSALLAMITGG